MYNKLEFSTDTLTLLVLFIYLPIWHLTTSVRYLALIALDLQTTLYTVFRRGILLMVLLVMTKMLQAILDMLCYLLIPSNPICTCEHHYISFPDLKSNSVFVYGFLAEQTIQTQK